MLFARLAVSRLSCLLLLLGSLLSPAAVAAGSPPDVHMEMTAPFRDPDGDAHAASDWEIRTADGATAVWAAYDPTVRAARRPRPSRGRASSTLRPAHQ